MKIFNIVFLIFVSQVLLGQNDFDLSLQTMTGYEYNVFNVHKDKLIIKDDIEEPALQSEYFQAVDVQASWDLKSKHHELGLSGKFRKEFFPQLKIANLYRPSAKIRYTLKFNRNHSFTLSGRYKIYRTNRPEDDTEVLRPPRSYERIEFSAKYKLSPFAGNKIYLQVRTINNEYATTEFRDFYYDGLKSTFSMNQKLHGSSKNKFYWETKADYSVRRYSDFTYNEDTDEEFFKEREWRYLGLSNEFKWYFRKKLKLTIGINVQERQDLLQNRFGYRQYQPFVKISVKRKSFDFALKGSVGRREYHTLKAGTDSDKLLIHDYYRASSRLIFKLNKKLRLIINSTLVSRSRNLSEGAKSFLAYTNARVSLGLKYNVF